MTDQFPEGGSEPSRRKLDTAGWFSRVFRLRGQLILPFAGLTLLMAIIGLVVVLRLVTSTFKERFVNQIYEAARLAADTMVEQENANLNHLRSVAFTQGMSAAVEGRDAGTIEALVAPIAYNYAIDSVTLVDRNGIEILTLGRDPQAGNYTRTAGGVDFSGHEFVQRALSGAADDQGDKYVALIRGDEGPTLYTSGPVYDSTRRRVVGAVLIGTPLSRMLTEMKSQRLTLADVLILDADRQILITTLAEPEGGFGSVEALAQSLQTAEMTGVYPLQMFGRNFQFTFSELTARGENMGWLGVALPGDYVVAAEARSRNWFLVIFLSGTLAVIGVGLVLSHSIAQPILKMRSMAQAVASGDLNQEVGLSRGDEIGELGNAFDRMTLRLRERTAETAQLYAEAIQRNQELAETNARLRSTQQQLIQSEKLGAIGQLTAGIVHDVKNPLTVIKGVAELLLYEDHLDEELRSEISLMRDSAVKANNIVSDLMKFARQSKPEMEVRDLRETVEAALRLTAFPIRKAHVQVIKDLPLRPVMLAFDDQQIEQVLVNMITNALQAMSSGGQLCVNLHTEDHTVAIAIQDTGVGIAPEHLSRIFDPFFTTKPEGEGTGLGLSVSYGIISNHNGRIEVESTLGQGSIFTIRLPMAAGALKPAEAPQTAEAPPMAERQL